MCRASGDVVLGLCCLYLFLKIAGGRERTGDGRECHTNVLVLFSLFPKHLLVATAGDGALGKLDLWPARLGVHAALTIKQARLVPSTTAS